MTGTTQTTRFRFWRWLIRFIGVIGAATLPRQVSPGMVKRRE
jgi:hypothetical protein